MFDYIAQIIEENETIYFLSFAVIAIALIVLFFERFGRPGTPEVICVYMDNPHGAFAYNGECPVCMEEVIFGLEGTCGHVYCGTCANELDNRTRLGCLITCALCRQTIDLFFKYQKNPDDVFPEELTRQMDAYNSYSLLSFPPNIWQTIKNMPVLLRHLFRTLRDREFEFDYLLIMACVSFLLMFLYFIIPQDLFPESVFGIYGLIDDIVVIFYCLFHLCVLYRNILGSLVET